MRRSLFVVTGLLAVLLAASVADARVVIGTAGSNTLVGTSASDTIDARAGNDLLYGRGGADRLLGGLGDDVLSGGSMADRLSGGAGGDHLYGGAGRDRLVGGAGSDRLVGGGGRDTVVCGGGRDVVVGGAADRIARSCEVQVSSRSVAAAGAASPPHQHGEDEGHLLFQHPDDTDADGDWGKLEFVSHLRVHDAAPDLVADVTVDPDGNFAYLANWGQPDCAGPERGGQTSPDAGAYVIDISDLENPVEVGFIPSHQDTRPGEGMHAVEITTKFFSGDMLVMNNEQCGPQGKGGVSLWDVTDPLKPKKLSEHFGDRGFADVNEIHSAFAWDAGDRAYVVMVDNVEVTDVDILDITNPHRPRLILDLDLNEFVEGGIFQPDIGLQESFLHDMVVKEIEGRFIMLLSYWDGGFVKLDVTDPANPIFLGDTEYPAIDPELLEETGIELPPEGNAHQAEFTIDNRFIIGGDEDFSPYRPVFEITTGPNAGTYFAGEFGWTVPIVTIEDGVVNGPTVYGGYGCPDDRDDIPDPSVLGPLDPGEEAILVLQRGPVADPTHDQHEACLFSEKVESAQLAGYDAVLIANHHVGAGGGLLPDAFICGSMGHQFEVTIPGVCIGHRTFHLLFGTEPVFDVPYAGGEPAIGTLGAEVSITATFDGWGYIHLFDATTLEELDTYAIPEAHDPDFAFGFGDLSVHEVAVDPQDASLAYLAYYSGGIRAIQIQCTDPEDTATCELVEVGGFIDPVGGVTPEGGNDFWGVETLVRDGTTYILGSDRDSGLYIFRDP